MKLIVNKDSIDVQGELRLLSGRIGVEFEFVLSEYWAGLNMIAVFENGITSPIKIENPTSPLTIPPEMLKTPDVTVYVGFYGYHITDGVKDRATNTVYTKLGYVGRGTDPSEAEESSDVTPDIAEQLQNDINALDERVSELEEGGGAAGKSAYDVAVDNGFVGTETEWLASLHGADGTDGADGAPGANGTDGHDGADGKSAYEIAVEHGFDGTEAEWLASLKGADGADGEDGVDGADGEQGPKGDKGDKGDTGAQGPQGIQGPAGPQGPAYTLTEEDKAEIATAAAEQIDLADYAEKTDLDELQSKTITDSAGYFTTDTVEGALAEIGAELAGVNTLLGSGVIT